jgi:cation transport ATPase
MKLELIVVVIGVVFIALMYILARVTNEGFYAKRKHRQRDAWTLVGLSIMLAFLLGTLF